MTKRIERPLMFSGALPQKIRDGAKTQTRRLVKYIPTLGEPENWCCKIGGDEFVKLVGDYKRFAPHPVGSYIWVKETWAENIPGCGEQRGYTYKADHLDPEGDGPANPIKWKSPRYMPRRASRTNLIVTDVRVERVQDISEEDAMAEGCAGTNCYRHPAFTCLVTDDGVLPKEEFEALWDSINGKKPGRSWADNPWVWAYTFEVVR